MIVIRRSGDNIAFARVARYMRLQDPYEHHFNWYMNAENATAFDDDVARYIAEELTKKAGGKHDYIAIERVPETRH